MFLNETQEVVNEFVFNVTTFIDENDRIISQIDEIIAGLADIHESINNVRLWIKLASGERIILICCFLDQLSDCAG